MGEITWNICKSFYVFFIYSIIIPWMRICCIVPLPKWCLQMRAQGIAAGFLMNWASKPLWTQACVFEWRRGFTHAKIFVSFPFQIPNKLLLLSFTGNNWKQNAKSKCTCVLQVFSIFFSYIICSVKRCNSSLHLSLMRKLMQ